MMTTLANQLPRINLGVLHAYDPANLAHELCNSGQAANGRDSFGDGNKFIAPVIVHLQFQDEPTTSICFSNHY